MAAPSDCSRPADKVLFNFLALSLSIRPHQFGEPKLFFAPKVANLPTPESQPSHSSRQVGVSGNGSVAIDQFAVPALLRGSTAVNPQPSTLIPQPQTLKPEP